MSMREIGAKLEAMGIKHAPEQKLLDGSGIDGRYVTLRDPPGLYYLIRGEVARGHAQGFEDGVQMIFLDVPYRDVGRYAAAIGYRVKTFERLECPDSDHAPIPSVLLEPL